MNAHIHHVNVTVPKSLEDAAKHFYGVVMGLEEVPKPEGSRGRGGAWYELGSNFTYLLKNRCIGIASANDTFVTPSATSPKLRNGFEKRASRSSPTIYPRPAGRAFMFAIPVGIV